MNIRIRLLRELYDKYQGRICNNMSQSEIEKSLSEIMTLLDGIIVVLELERAEKEGEG